MKAKTIRLLSTLTTCLLLLLLFASCSHKHAYGEWTVEKAPTCTEEGTIARKCECGDVQAQSLDTLAHTYGEWAIEKSPTCTESGTIARKCTCGDKQTDSLDALGHTDGEWIVHKDSTVNTEGEKHLLCANCGSVIKKETIPTKRVDENGNVLPPDFDFMGNDLTGIINLGQYKGYTVEVEPKIEITEELFNEEIRKEIIIYGQYNEIKVGTVKKSDIVKIKYVGYLEGEKFDGGEGTSEYFTVYDGGGFIEGFAEGIIGAEVGKEIDVNVTFPEDYHAEELAGKPAVFKVTVECIYEAKEMTDELVKELSGGKISTHAEFKEQAWKLMEENIELEYKNARLTAVWKKILESSTEIKLPEDALQQYIDYNVDYDQQYAAYYGMTLESFLASQGITLEEIEEGAREEFFYECVLFSIIKAENITITEDDYTKYLEEMKEYNGVDEETIYEYYTKDELTEMFLMTKGYESVLEWNTFTHKVADNNDQNMEKFTA